MGANFFEVESSCENLEEAFQEEVNEALSHYGNGGYTGTIAEKESYIQLSDKVMWADEAETLANKLLEENNEQISDKWGPAGALPICHPTKRVSVEIEGSSSTDWESELARVKKDKGAVGFGSMLVGVFGGADSEKIIKEYYIEVPREEAGEISTEILNLNIHGEAHGHKLKNVVSQAVAEKYSKKKNVIVLKSKVVHQEPRVKVLATSGSKRSTRYVVRADNGLNKVLGSFKTLPEAKAYARDLAKSPPPYGGPLSLIVEGVVSAMDEEPLFTATQVILNTKTRVEVTIVKGRKPAPERDGWYFFGWASD